MENEIGNAYSYFDQNGIYPRDIINLISVLEHNDIERIVENELRKL